MTTGTSAAAAAVFTVLLLCSCHCSAQDVSLLTADNARYVDAGFVRESVCIIRYVLTSVYPKPGGQYRKPCSNATGTIVLFAADGGHNILVRGQ